VDNDCDITGTSQLLTVFGLTAKMLLRLYKAMMHQSMDSPSVSMSTEAPLPSPTIISMIMVLACGLIIQVLV